MNAARFAAGRAGGWSPMRTAIALLVLAYSCVLASQEAQEGPPAYSQEPLEAPPVLRALLSHCAGLKNSLECARTIEQVQLESDFGRYFERAEGVLRIRVDNKVVTLRDGINERTREGSIYSYLTFLPEQQLHVLHRQFYEGYAYAVVHHRTGGLARIDGFPIISPDARRFVAISNAGDGLVNANSVEVWRVQNGRMRREYRI